MNDLERRAQELSPLLVSAVSAADTERALGRFEIAKKARARRRVVSAVAFVIALVGAGASAWRVRPPSPAPELAVTPAPRPPLPAEDQREVHFADGSRAVLEDGNTQLKVSSASDALHELILESGRARFTVTPNPARLFRVRVGDLRVEVLGTEFTVSAGDAEAAVEVHRGRVAVYAQESRHELGAGMRFAVAKTQPSPPVAELPAPRPTKKAKARPAKPAGDTKRWKHLATDGLFAEAYEAMKEPEQAPATDLAELMLAADVARLTGHSEEAARYLSTALTHFRDRPQAELAAFTLGRLYEQKLRRPAEAAEAFRTARELAPKGSLAEDALAHEVECWLEAGQRERAVAEARAYLRLYPRGRKVERMRSLGGE